MSARGSMHFHPPVKGMGRPGVGRSLMLYGPSTSTLIVGVNVAKDVQFRVNTFYHLQKTYILACYTFYTERECKTVRGEYCVFPFWHNNREYYKCTWDGAITKSNGKPWCGTTFNSTMWDACTEGCPTEGNDNKDLIRL